MDKLEKRGIFRHLINIIDSYPSCQSIRMEAGEQRLLAHRVNESHSRIKYSVENHQLQIAQHKTKAVVLKGPRNRQGVKTGIAVTEVPVGNQVK